MSRIGKMPLELPKGVTATVAAGKVTVSGPKGELALDLIRGIDVSLEEGVMTFRRASEHPQVRANHGLMRSLTSNMVQGVSQGFTKRLEVQGIGYRAEVRGNKLVLNLGYSHNIEFPIPSDIQIAVDKDNRITVSGIDKGRVGQIAANIRGLRKPDRYKGKGVRYEGEYINLKAGKSA